MVGEIQRVLESDTRVAYALLFGSSARGSAHATSDADVAIGLTEGTSLSPLELGEMVSRLETAAGRVVDLLLGKGQNCFIVESREERFLIPDVPGIVRTANQGMA